MAIDRCRIWWPRQQPQLEQDSGPVSHILFGWLFTGVGSLDAVVSAAIPQDQILRAFTTLDTLQSTVFSSNKLMPANLQESATFTILGDCVGVSVQAEKIKSAVKEGTWMHFSSNSGKSFKRNLIKVHHHLYLHGQQIKMDHCHVILYDVPTVGRNHFSLGVDAPHKLKPSIKKPNWINDLQKKPPVLDLGPVVLALNCSNAARQPIAQEYFSNISQTHFFFKPIFDALVQVTWNCMGKVFKNSWNNIHLRSCQILYWPVVLQDPSLSSTVNAEHVHKTAIQKHTLWSNIVVDLLMGFLLGAACLLNSENICAGIVGLVHSTTDGILRPGCVWLMGVPAGFKLNTELAELLGMISLNAVQIYSTLWFFMGGFLRHIIQGIAFSGMILGFTVPVSFVIDIIHLATLHITMLHWLISLIYSSQIHTVASLWRLFRGRKWNPLRQRLDSYDYTVEQHVQSLDCSEKKTELLIHGQPESLVSELHCNYANLVEVIRSNYEEIFNRTGFSFCKQLAYGILSGERVPSSLHLRLSPPFPWMNTSILEYWLRCRSSVLSCAPRR
ncbi:hypothetical protein QOZ80_1AG0006520 [Eleusine coracana subsp. coracana]|nr:hypothetical protein QOZ80_1AG0006520 [Eleusine coracana subsp. coracana]